MFGTAKPTNAIGPQKAVMVPVNNVMQIMMSKRVFFKFIPK